MKSQGPWEICKLKNDMIKVHGSKGDNGFLKKFNTGLPHNPAILLLSIQSKHGNGTQKSTHTYVRSSAIHNSQKMEMVQTSINK